MWGFIKRTFVPGVLLLAGIASLVYGTAFHVVPVTEEQEIEKKIIVPTAFGPPGMGDPFFAGGFPEEESSDDEDPFSSTPTRKVKVRVVKTYDQSEPSLVREVTFGGVVLLASGELRRTYSGTPPSLCPS